jgi:hypothetical protein
VSEYDEEEEKEVEVEEGNGSLSYLRERREGGRAHGVSLADVLRSS